MATFPKSIATGAEGAAKATAASSGGGKKFTTNFFWKAGDKRYVQFLTEYEGIPTLPMHIVKQPGLKWLANFVDPRAWHGEDADNALVEVGAQPSLKRLAVAVEVVPIMGTKNGRKVPVGWEPATRTFTRKNGEEVTVPNVGVIINTQTLYAHVDNYYEDNGTITDAVFSITRNGSDTSTSYSVTPQKGEPVEVTDELLNEIDLAEYCESMADSAAIRELVESAPDGFEFDYSQRDKPAKSKSKKAQAPVEDDEWDDGPDEDEDEDDTRTRKNTKFAGMKAQLG